MCLHNLLALQTFAVICYAQAICAMRAVNLLRDYLVNEETEERIDIKVRKRPSSACAV